MVDLKLVKSRKNYKSRNVVFVFIILLKLALFTIFDSTPQAEFVALRQF